MDYHTLTVWRRRRRKSLRQIDEGATAPSVFGYVGFSATDGRSDPPPVSAPTRWRRPPTASPTADATFHRLTVGRIRQQLPYELGGGSPLPPVYGITSRALQIQRVKVEILTKRKPYVVENSLPMPFNAIKNKKRRRYLESTNMGERKNTACAHRVNSPKNIWRARPLPRNTEISIKVRIVLRNALIRSALAYALRTRTQKQRHTEIRKIYV